MGDDAPSPNVNDFRFADDGTMEIFDGSSWRPFHVPYDDGSEVIFKAGKEGSGNQAPHPDGGRR